LLASPILERTVSQETIEIVRDSVAAWNRGDVDSFIACFDPDCEVVFRPDVPEPGPFRGRSELRQWVDSFRAAWESFQVEIVEPESVADRVFAKLRVVGRAASTGIGINDTHVFVYTVRDGQIVRWQGFIEADEARAAAGLNRPR
jgi:ketosteroid isomerase-like protein